MPEAKDPLGLQGWPDTGTELAISAAAVPRALRALRMLLKEPLPGIGTISVLIVPDEEIGSQPVAPGSSGRRGNRMPA